MMSILRYYDIVIYPIDRAWKRSRIVIGFLGTTLDAAARPSAGRNGGRRSRCASTKTSASTASSCIHDGAHASARRAGRPPTSPRVSPETRGARHVIDLRDPWDFEEVYGELHDFARAYPFDPEARGLSRPHHHRHPCRADLLVPADRGALHPGQLLQLTPPQTLEGRRRRRIRHHRPRSVALRPHRHPLPRRAGRGRPPS